MQQLNRSHSFLGALKNIVSVAIPWVGNGSEKQGKRKTSSAALDPEDNADERKNKRKRVESPQAEPRDDVRMKASSQSMNRRPQTGYLDPPTETFQRQAPATPRRALSHIRAASVATPDRAARRGLQRGRTLSPGASYANPMPNGLVRTQSMDPPRRRVDSQRKAPQPISRDVSMESINSDRSTSPPTKPFRMRQSMTPQPGSQGTQVFGPSPKRLHREPSEPPALSTVIGGTAFVKAPSAPPTDRQSDLAQAETTLGSLAEAQREHRPLKRSRSSLMLDDESNAPESGDELGDHRVNTAEKARRSLEAFRTPLLPTRLQGSSSQTHQSPPKKGRTGRWQQDRERGSRNGLGRADDEQNEDRVFEEDEESPRKPYAGRGGMKKLLARRRMEEEEAKEKTRKDKLEVIEEAEEEDIPEKEQQGEGFDAQPEPEADRRPEVIGGREQSSLRVGRKRGNRNHIPRPSARPQRAGRFSALFDEEDDDAMALDEEQEQERRELEEAAKKAPVFNLPSNFTFAKDVPPPIRHDDGETEPPISSLPFSLTKRSSGSSSLASTSSMSLDIEPPKASNSGSSMSIDKPSVAPPSVSAFSFAKPAPLGTTTPPLTSTAAAALYPTPASSEILVPAPPAPKTVGGVPDFFATSSIFNKPGATNVSTDKQTSLVLCPPVAASGEESRKASSAPAAFTFGKASDGKASTGASSAPSFFGALAQPAEEKPVSSPPSTTPAPQLSIFGAASKSATTTPAPASSPFTIGAPVPSKAAEPAPPAIVAPAPVAASGTPAFSFGAPPQPAAERATAAPSPAPSPFTFGAPVKPVETPAAPAATTFNFGAASAPKADVIEVKSVSPAVPATAASGTSSFGDASAAKPFNFGASTPATNGFATPTPEPPKSPFLFGQPPSQSASAASAPPTAPATPVPVIEAPKPKAPFGGSSTFNFGQPPTSQAPGVEPPKSPFTFGVAPAAAAAAEKKPFAFGSPSPVPPSTPAGAAAAPSLLFGGTSGTTAATTDGSKPFTFGAPPVTPARPTTPPKNGGDSSMMMMDESPLRPPNDMNVSGGKPELPKLNGFSFGASPASPSPFGQPSGTSGSTGFGFGASAATSSLFGAKPAETKPADKPTLGFGFGQQGASTPTFSFGQKSSETATPASAGNSFSFGQKAPETTTAAAPTTSAPFSFGQKATETAATTTSNASNTFNFGAPAASTTSTTGFGFGAPQIAPSTSFGPTSAGSNAPASPFAQTAPGGGYNFPATPTSATTASNPFHFGASQPASPAAANAGLPSQPASAGFSFGAGPSAPFGGGASFTMGAAPAPSPSTARPIRKLPNRRGGKR